MKKSLLLIPSLVALSATPFIGLTSCFEDEDDPTPPGPTPGPESWEVTKAEMERAISMKGVVYGQFNEETEFSNGEKQNNIENFSPSKAYHVLSSSTDTQSNANSYFENYYEQNGTDSIEWSRGSDESDSWGCMPVAGIPIAEDTGKALLDVYKLPIEQGNEYIKDANKKCYYSYYLDQYYGETYIAFYFQNKKLIAIEQQNSGLHDCGTFTYKIEDVTDPTVIDVVNDYEDESGYHWLSSDELNLSYSDYFKFYADFEQCPDILSSGNLLLAFSTEPKSINIIEFKVTELYVDDTLIPEEKDNTWWFYSPGDDGQGFVVFSPTFVEQTITNKSKIRGTIKFNDSASVQSLCFSDID